MTYTVKRHPFGLDLSAEDKKALIAFLKTLWRRTNRLGLQSGPPGNTPSLSKLADLHMLVMAGGERTPAEFQDLLGSAGFEVGGIYPTAAPHSIIEGIPA